MRKIAIITVCVASLCYGAAQSPADPVVRAREHAEHSSAKGEAKAYVELVRALVDAAGAEYTAQHYDKTAQDLADAKEALAKARQSAEQHKHDAKQCDLILDKVDRRLRDYAHAFAAQDRPAVIELTKQVQSTRERLLQIVIETR